MTKRSFGTALEKIDPPPLSDAHRHDRLRIGYVSSDFRDHPVASQFMGLLERHDRTRFRNHRLGQWTSRHRPYGAAHRELAASFTTLAAWEASNPAAGSGCVDRLNGQTLGCAIFNSRPAPVSAAYLGFAGTTGADFIDYIIGDATVTPFALASAMSEKIVQLPHSFWPSDPTGAGSFFSRAEAGLPEEVFIFCCFNSKSQDPAGDVRHLDAAVARRAADALWICEGTHAMNARFRETRAK